MKEDFVDYDLAVKLKEKGFPQEEKNTLAMYNEDGEWFSLARNLDTFEYLFEDFDDKDCVCPTISQVFKWLREKHAIHIEISLGGNGWYFEIIQYEYEEKEYDCKLITISVINDSYEQAALAGIEYVIDNLI